MDNIVKALKILYCRSFQGAVKIGNFFIDYHSPKRIMGEGAILKIPEILKRENVCNLLLVTGTHIYGSGILDSLISKLEKENIKCSVYAINKTDPDFLDVESGFEKYKENGCNAILAVGGGSRIDCAKGIAAKVANPKKSIEKMQGLFKVGNKVPLLIAVPTTSGSGSETTVAAVITNPKTHKKAAISDTSLIPKYAVLDPVLASKMSPFTAAVTGLDALTHAVEAYINGTYNTSLENRLALNAVKLVNSNVLKVYKDGNNMEAVENMQKAAFYAGRAFTRGAVGYVHAIGHTVGGLYNLPHGLCMAVILPYVLEEYGEKAQKKLSDLAKICNIYGKNDEQRADNFIKRIRFFNEQMGIPKKFYSVIDQKDIENMAKNADKEANPLYPVPKIMTVSEIENIIKSTMG